MNVASYAETVEPTLPLTAEPVVIIKPSSGLRSLGLGELWEYRELLFFFVWRDIKVRYKQTLLGGAWAIIQPLAFTIVGTIIFGQIAGAGTDGVKPAFLFYLVSQLPWMLFNTGLQTSAMSLVGAQNMIKKVYFPRLILPAIGWSWQPFEMAHLAGVAAPAISSYLLNKHYTFA